MNIQPPKLDDCLTHMKSIGYRLDARGMGLFIFRQGEHRELTLDLHDLREKFKRENKNGRKD